MLREINFKLFRKLLRKSKLKSITIDIDSSVVNVEGHQEGAVKGYNPKKPGNRCYNIQFAFCDEIKAYLTGYLRSGDTYTANGAAEMIKEIMTHLKEEGLEITFRMVAVILTMLSWKRSNRWVASMSSREKGIQRLWRK
jgi:hypothetical protein